MVGLLANVTDVFQGGPNLVTQQLAGLGIIPPLWGIFSSGGSAVVKADNVIAFEYKQDWNVADAPQEQGAFMSYDKVNTPFTARVTFSAGGGFSNRQALLKSVAAISGDLNLYDVVTPEATYTSCNVIHYDYRRTADHGANLIEVTVWLTQIITDVGATSSSTPSTPSGSTNTDGGTVQPTAIDTSSPQAQTVIQGAFNEPSPAQSESLGQVMATNPALPTPPNANPIIMETGQSNVATGFA